MVFEFGSTALEDRQTKGKNPTLSYPLGSTNEGGLTSRRIEKNRETLKGASNNGVSNALNEVHSHKKIWKRRERAGVGNLSNPE